MLAPRGVLALELNAKPVEIFRRKNERKTSALPSSPNTPSASYSPTLRVKLSSRAGTLGELTTPIGPAGGDIGAIDIVSVGRDSIVRDLTVHAASAEHGSAIVDSARSSEENTSELPSR